MLLTLVSLISLQEEDCFRPLPKIVEKLDAGAAEYLKGADPAQAFQPWPILGKGPELRQVLRDAGAASLATHGLMFNLIYFKQGKPVYGVEVELIASPKEIVVGQLRGGETGYSSAPFRDFAGDASPFREAAQRFADALRTKDAKKIPLADAKKLAVHYGAKEEDLLLEPDRVRERLEKAMEGIASCGADEVQLALDQYDFLARDSGGNALGRFSCGWVWADGKLHLKLKKFRPVKK